MALRIPGLLAQVWPVPPCTPRGPLPLPAPSLKFTARRPSWRRPAPAPALAHVLMDVPGPQVMLGSLKGLLPISPCRPGSPSTGQVGSRMHLKAPGPEVWLPSGPEGGSREGERRADARSTHTTLHSLYPLLLLVPQAEAVLSF